MLNLMQEMQAVGHLPIRRVVCFSAALALRQNNPQIALDLVSSIPNQGFFLIRSIKVNKFYKSYTQFIKTSVFITLIFYILGFSNVCSQST